MRVSARPRVGAGSFAAGASGVLRARPPDPLHGCHLGCLVRLRFGPAVVSAPISAPEVCALFQAGASVADIATRYMVTDRRVRQIVQDGVVRRDLQPQPSEAVLDQIMAAETARFGFGMFDVAWCIAAAVPTVALHKAGGVWWGSKPHQAP